MTIKRTNAFVVLVAIFFALGTLTGLVAIDAFNGFGDFGPTKAQRIQAFLGSAAFFWTTGGVIAALGLLTEALVQNLPGTTFGDARSELEVDEGRDALWAQDVDEHDADAESDAL